MMRGEFGLNPPNPLQAEVLLRNRPNLPQIARIFAENANGRLWESASICEIRGSIFCPDFSDRRFDGKFLACFGVAFRVRMSRFLVGEGRVRLESLTYANESMNK